VRLIGERKALPAKFDLDRDFDYMLLCSYIRSLSTQFSNYKVVIPYGRELSECYPTRFARSMRDYDHFCALIEASAIFHFCQRPVLVTKEQKRVVSKNPDVQHDYVTAESSALLATLLDLKFVTTLWTAIQETTETGLPGHILQFFYKAVKPLCGYGASSYHDLTVKHNEEAAEKKSSSTIRKWCRFLSDIGWVDIEKDPSDKRTYLVRSIKDAKNLGNSALNISTGFFSLEDFQKWLDDTKKICAQSELSLRQTLLDEESSLKLVYEKHFYAQTFPDPSKPDPEREIEKEPLNVGITESPRISREKTVSMLPLDEPYRGRCVNCQLEATLCFQITNFKDQFGDVCNDCAQMFLVKGDN